MGRKSCRKVNTKCNVNKILNATNFNTNYYHVLTTFHKDYPTPVDLSQQGVLDTGCSRHALRHDAPSDDRQTTESTIVCGTPTGDTMHSNEEALLKHQGLPTAAREANHYDDLAYKSLVSVGQICDAGYRS